jgi:hypothetical protein
MNGQFLGCRSIRTNWATRKPPSAKAEGKYLCCKIHVTVVSQEKFCKNILIQNDESKSFFIK